MIYWNNVNILIIKLIKIKFELIADKIQEKFPNLVNGEKDGDILQIVDYIQ